MSKQRLTFSVDMQTSVHNRITRIWWNGDIGGRSFDKAEFRILHIGNRRVFILICGLAEEWRKVLNVLTYESINQYINQQMHLIKYNKIHNIKHDSSTLHVSAPEHHL